MLTSKESEAIEQLLKWLSGFEETMLFQDYVQLSIFTNEEFESVWCVLDEAVRRHKSASVSAEGLRLCRILTPERACLGCEREGVPLMVMARTPEDARRLLFSDEFGLCDECICQTLIESKMPVTQVTVVEGDEATRPITL